MHHPVRAWGLWDLEPPTSQHYQSVGGLKRHAIDMTLKRHAISWWEVPQNAIS